MGGGGVEAVGFSDGPRWVVPSMFRATLGQGGAHWATLCHIVGYTGPLQVASGCAMLKHLFTR